jgi:hypothetical protein
MGGHPLVGLWFHSFDGENLRWQGQVVGVDGDVAIVQLYEWIVGSASDIKTVQKADMYDSSKFHLYPSCDHMNYEYKMYNLSRENRDGAR